MRKRNNEKHTNQKSSRQEIYEDFIDLQAIRAGGLRKTDSDVSVSSREEAKSTNPHRFHFARHVESDSSDADESSGRLTDFSPKKIELANAVDSRARVSSPSSRTHNSRGHNRPSKSSVLGWPTTNFPMKYFSLFTFAPGRGVGLLMSARRRYSWKDVLWMSLLLVGVGLIVYLRLHAENFFDSEGESISGNEDKVARSYAVLEIPSGSNWQAVREAYRKRALAVHPDALEKADSESSKSEPGSASRSGSAPGSGVGLDPSVSKYSFEEVSQAYETLSRVLGKGEKSGKRSGRGGSSQGRKKSVAGSDVEFEALELLSGESSLPECRGICLFLVFDSRDLLDLEKSALVLELVAKQLKDGAFSDPRLRHFNGVLQMYAIDLFRDKRLAYSLPIRVLHPVGIELVTSSESGTLISANRGVLAPAEVVDSVVFGEVSRSVDSFLSWMDQEVGALLGCKSDLSSKLIDLAVSAVNPKTKLKRKQKSELSLASNLILYSMQNEKTCGDAYSRSKGRHCAASEIQQKMIDSLLPKDSDLEVASKSRSVSRPASASTLLYESLLKAIRFEEVADIDFSQSSVQCYCSEVFNNRLSPTQSDSNCVLSRFKSPRCDAGVFPIDLTLDGENRDRNFLLYEVEDEDVYVCPVHDSHPTHDDHNHDHDHSHERKCVSVPSKCFSDSEDSAATYSDKGLISPYIRMLNPMPIIAKTVRRMLGM